ALADQRQRTLNVDEILDQQSAAMREGLAMMKDKLAGSKRFGISEQELARTQAMMEQQLEEHRLRLIAAKEGRVKTPIQPNEAVHCAEFSYDGRWLVCGTDYGIRVYSWDSVLHAQTEVMPPPVLSYRPMPRLDDPNQITAISSLWPE